MRSFSAGLDLSRSQVGAPDGHELARVAQLTQRTNQFNSSLKRRTISEVMALSSEAKVLVLKGRDRFGDYGSTGLAIMRPESSDGVWELDTLLMSCRVLGRGVEDAFLHAMGGNCGQPRCVYFTGAFHGRPAKMDRSASFSRGTTLRSRRIIPGSSVRARALFYQPMCDFTGAIRQPPQPRKHAAAFEPGRTTDQVVT